MGNSCSTKIFKNYRSEKIFKSIMLWLTPAFTSDLVKKNTAKNGKVNYNTAMYQLLTHVRWVSVKSFLANALLCSQQGHFVLRTMGNKQCKRAYESIDPKFFVHTMIGCNTSEFFRTVINLTQNMFVRQCIDSANQQETCTECSQEDIDGDWVKITLVDSHVFAI